MKAEERAPGWRVRCRKCGWTEPWGKYGIRLAAAGRSYTIGWCARCRWIRVHVIERDGGMTAAGQRDEQPAG